MNTIFKVWLPDQSPTSSEPLLTLHNSTQAMRFFVEAMANGSSLFAGKAFAMVAYDTDNLHEREIAHGTYQVQTVDNHIVCKTLYEDGPIMPGTGCNVIATAIIKVCMAAAEARENFEG